jgi:hypothetical protein
VVAVIFALYVAFAFGSAAGLLHMARGTTELIGNPRVRMWFFGLQALIAMAGAAAAIAVAFLMGLAR